VIAADGGGGGGVEDAEASKSTRYFVYRRALAIPARLARDQATTGMAIAFPDTDTLSAEHLFA
jgi:hypothetical protein